jgi:serine/threonine protein kinase
MVNECALRLFKNLVHFHAIFGARKSMPHTQPVRVRVGVFELDLSAGELRAINGGGPAACIVLPQQPLRVLSMLLERPGQLVSREEIQKKLWPNDTVVEFEPSINAAIAKLRKAFGESANEPSYIETIAKRGYRLIAPTEWLTDSGESSLTGIVSSGNGSAARMQLEPTGLTGKVVSHYRVLDIIGGGGMGVVYRAEDLTLGRLVALKFLPEEVGGDPRALERFKREARAASALDHPNICSIYEFGEHEGQPFIVMQLLEGETLRERLSSASLQTSGPEANGGQTFSLDELLDIARQIADGLQVAHERGIIHRDIKPANIFLTRRGLVKILDFGVAKLTEAADAPEDGLVFGHDLSRTAAAAYSDSTAPTPAVPADPCLTRTGLAMGTVGYMSPEQVRGEKVDARTDIFSFGVVLYEMATGRRAFNGETALLIHDAILSQTPAPAHELNAAIPPKLEQIINRAIEKSPERRYQTAAEMAANLQSLTAHQPTVAKEVDVHKRSAWKWLAAVAVMVVATLAGWLYWRAHRAPKLTDRDTIVISDFVNRTGNPVFDDTLKQALSVELSQSPFLNILSNRRVRAILKDLKRSADEPLTEGVAREVCRDAGSKVVVAGSIGVLRNDYILDLKAVDCNTGSVLAEAQEQAPDKETVLKALDEAAMRVRKQMGEPISSVQKYATPVAEATTASLEAWKLYSMASRIDYEKGAAAALPLWKRAVEVDPSFARAYAALSTAYANRGELQLAEQYALKAYELRDKVTERERFMIQATYDMRGTGDLDKAARTYEQWRHSYPKDLIPVGNLSVLYSWSGKLEEALDVGRQVVRLEPNLGMVYANLEEFYMCLNRLEEAAATLKEAEDRKLTSDDMLVRRYELAFLLGDSAQMRQVAASAVGKPAIEDNILSTQADTEQWYGRFKAARKLTQQAMESAQRNGDKGTAASYEAGEAMGEAAAGFRQQARATAVAALALDDNRLARAVAAIALAQAGDVAEAERLTSWIDKEDPLSSGAQRYWLPTMRAAIALERKDPTRALELLSELGARELDPGSLPLYPAYLRGEAFLMLGDGKAAAGEFHKFIDHYGLVRNRPWGALARLGLARAYTLEAANDPAARDKARTAYENFLTLWKDADPDIPIYKQAKAEYAKLQ